MVSLDAGGQGTATVYSSTLPLCSEGSLGHSLDPWVLGLWISEDTGEELGMNSSLSKNLYFAIKFPPPVSVGVNGNSSWGRGRHRYYVWPLRGESELGGRTLSVKKSRSEESSSTSGFSSEDMSPPPRSPHQPLSVPWGTDISSCLACTFLYLESISDHFSSLSWSQPPSI